MVRPLYVTSMAFAITVSLWFVTASASGLL